MPSETPKDWELNVLGRFQLRRPGGEDAGLSSKKTMGLLAALAVAPGKALSRERITGLLWSDRGTAQARSSLRQALMALKKELGEATPPPVDVDGETIRLAANVRADAVEFEALARGGTPQDLRAAGALYRGDLLEALVIADTAFDEGLRPERERLRDLAVRVHHQLAGTGEADERLAAARRLVALDPLIEASHRLLMEAHLAAGDTAAAVRQFESCCRLLKAELGISPGAELSALRQSLATGSAPVRPGKPSVAVLPFENAGGDPAQRIFSDGVSEDIINGLSRFSGLSVIARHSSFRFRDSTGDTAAVARQLHVRYLVTGSVRRSGDNLRIAAQLIDCTDGRVLWSDRFDRTLADLFAVQDEVTQLIVAALTGQIESLEIREALARPTSNLEAYDCLLHGMEFLRSYGPGVNRQAIAMFERAIALDPGYGLAHGYLALALLVEHQFDSAQPEIKSRALQAALRAVQLAPGDSRCHQYLGDAHLFTGNAAQALVEYERAIALNPNDANALIRYGFGLAKDGRSEEALKAAYRAIELNPFHPDYYWSDMAIVTYAAGRYEESLAACRKLAGYGRFYDHARIAACLAQLGRLEEARVAAARVLELNPDFRVSGLRLIYTDPQTAERVRDGMRKAGLPE